MTESFSQILGEFVKKMEDFITLSRGSDKEWSINMMEEVLRSCLKETGSCVMNLLIQQKAKEAEEYVKTCNCGKKLPPHRKETIKVCTIYGEVKIESTYHYCEECGMGDNPAKRMMGIRDAWKSSLLQRVLVDFGSDESFHGASRKIKEHYGLEISPSTIRNFTLEHGRRGWDFVERKVDDAVEQYEQSSGKDSGVEKLIIECDGSEVRTGQLRDLTPEEKEKAVNELEEKGGSSKTRRKRETIWREVRLIAAQRHGEVDTRYLAAMQKSQEIGHKMFGLALLCGMGERTKVYGVGDGAPWISEEFKTNFPQGEYLLGKYHLIEHINDASEGLKTRSEKVKKRWAEKQIKRIEEGLIDQVLQECEKKATGKKDSQFSRLMCYIKERRGYLDYRKAKDEGIPEGSGIVESGHRHVIQKRLKLPGTWWKEENVNPMCALRIIKINGWWEDYWKNEASTN